jgi:hypothetical protein
MARADSAAVVENTVIATCSLISKYGNGEDMWGLCQLENLLNGPGFINLQKALFRVVRRGLNGPGMISSKTTPKMYDII